jgi:hypothetical protein
MPILYPIQNLINVISKNYDEMDLKYFIIFINLKF